MSEEWSSVNTVSVYSSIEEIKEVLFYEFDFFCAENAVIVQCTPARFLTRKIPQRAKALWGI